MPHRVLSDYQREISRLDYTRKRMESLFRRGAITLRDISTVYESLLLRSVVGFERFCERLFLEIVEGRLSYPASRVTCHVNGVPSAVVRKFVFLGKNYLDWLPYDRTIQRARVYLRGGRPFTVLPTTERDKIEIILHIRHAIAHSSAHSLKTFREEVIGTRIVPPRERVPAGWLRAHVTPGVTRLQVYWGELGAIAEQIYGTPRV